MLPNYKLDIFHEGFSRKCFCGEVLWWAELPKNAFSYDFSRCQNSLLRHKKRPVPFQSTSIEGFPKIAGQSICEPSIWILTSDFWYDKSVERYSKVFAISNLIFRLNYGLNYLYINLDQQFSTCRSNCGEVINDFACRMVPW